MADPCRRSQDGAWWSARPGTGRAPRAGHGRSPFTIRAAGLLARTGGVLVGTHAAAVHTDDPLQLTDRVRLGLHMGQQPVPGAVAAPSNQPVVAGLPGAVPLGQIAPGRAGPQLPQDAVNDTAVVSPAAAALLVTRQQRCKLRPGGIGELPAADHDAASSTGSTLVSRAAEATKPTTGQTRLSR